MTTYMEWEGNYINSISKNNYNKIKKKAMNTCKIKKIKNINKKKYNEYEKDIDNKINNFLKTSKCYICQKDFKYSFLDKFDIEHKHEIYIKNNIYAGRLRGFACRSCNIFEGKHKYNSNKNKIIKYTKFLHRDINDINDIHFIYFMLKNNYLLNENEMEEEFENIINEIN